MKFNEWVNDIKAKGGIDRDGAYGKQCMDLYNDYCERVLGLIGVGADCAKNIIYNSNIMNNVQRIDNYAEFVPQKGDIAVWQGGQYGHVAICLGQGDINYFRSIEQNWVPLTLTEENHDYFAYAPIIFLRPNNQSNINPPPEPQPQPQPQPRIKYKAHMQEYGWSDWVKEGEVAGTTGEERRIEAIIIDGEMDLQYRVHMEGKGWGDFVNKGEIAGTTGECRRIEAIEINSSVNLRVEEHIEHIGWMPKSEGTHIKIGTEGKALRLEAFKISVM